MSLIQKNDYDPPKSYVLRKGRITKAQKRALTNLKNLHVLPIETKKIDFTKAFTTSNKTLVADVGFGSGASLVYMAENYRKTNFRSEEHTSELQSRRNLVCRLLLEKKNTIPTNHS